MGDIADDIYNRYVDEGGAFYKIQPPPKCKHCGKTDLNWQKVKGGKWRLHEGRAPHVCQPTANGFTEVPDA